MNIEHARGSNKFCLIALAVIVIGAFLLRTSPYLSKIFTPDGIVYIEMDAYYHMRIAENMTWNFPIMLSYDPYFYPDGMNIGGKPMLSWLISGISLILGHGAPTQSVVDSVGAWLPAILGSLLIIPIYLIGKEVFNSPLVGLVGSLFVAVLPDETLHRSLLGFTDHHVLEMLFTVCTLLFLVRATNKSRIKFAIIAGLFLGALFYSWNGALLLVAIIGLWYVISAVCKLIQKESLKNITIKTAVCCVIGLGLYLPYQLNAGGSTGGPDITATTTLVRDIPYYVRWVLGFVPSSVEEMQPSTPIILYYLYGASLLFALVGTYYAIKNRLNALFIVWFVVTLIAAISQRRWGYYTGLGIGVFGAYGICRLGEHFQAKFYKLSVTLMVSIVVVTVLPGITHMVSMSSPVTPEWQRALNWMRENTIEPFSENNVYEGLFNGGIKPSYGVLSHRDYGNWIKVVARRAPLVVPGGEQDPRVAKFLIAQTDGEAEAAIVGLNVRYVIIDDVMVSGTFYSLVEIATGSGKGWESLLANSMVSRLYYSAGFGHYKLVHREGKVKIYERTE